MNSAEETIRSLAPGVRSFKRLEGHYNSRHGLAIYFLPTAGPSIAQPGTVLGEALASRSGLGCTLLEGIPEKIPEGAAVVGIYSDLKKLRPELLGALAPPTLPGEYIIILGRHALVAGKDRDGLVSGIQTLAMTILRHGEATIPGTVIRDRPAKRKRGLRVALRQEEATPALMFQILSFASTFKANAVGWILPRDFDPGAVPNLEVVNLATASDGIDVSVGMPLLGAIASGETSLSDAWIRLRSAAALFGTAKAFFDDPCPDDIDPETAWRIALAIVEGVPGLSEIAVDYRLLKAAGIYPQALEVPGLRAWARVDDPADLAEISHWDGRIALDVPSHMCGLSPRSLGAFNLCLDAASTKLGDPGGDIGVSFRGLGFNHAWQNYLPGAATGLIVAWGSPATASRAAHAYAELLYGEAAPRVVEIWQALSGLFPEGTGDEQVRRLGEIAFGAWPESPEDRQLLASIDWQKVVASINTIAGLLEKTAPSLTRNRSTLAGPYLSLQIMAWLCRLAILLPGLIDEETAANDIQTAGAACELMQSFTEWRLYLENLQGESGMEIINMSKLDAMGARLRYLCGEQV